MPTTCGFPNCRFRSRYRGAEDNRHFYRVPKKPAILRKRWLEAIGRTEETIVSQLRVCSGHFHGGEKHEGDIPVADPTVDELVRIELPPKTPRLSSSATGHRFGIRGSGGVRGSHSQGTRAKMSLLRPGVLSYLSKGTHHPLLNHMHKSKLGSASNLSSYHSQSVNLNTQTKWLPADSEGVSKKEQGIARFAAGKRNCDSMEIFPPPFHLLNSPSIKHLGERGPPVPFPIPFSFPEQTLFSQEMTYANINQTNNNISTVPEAPRSMSPLNWQHQQKQQQTTTSFLPSSQQPVPSAVVQRTPLSAFSSPFNSARKATAFAQPTTQQQTTQSKSQVRFLQADLPGFMASQTGLFDSASLIHLNPLVHAFTNLINSGVDVNYYNQILASMCNALPDPSPLTPMFLGLKSRLAQSPSGPCQSSATLTTPNTTKAVHTKATNATSTTTSASLSSRSNLSDLTVPTLAASSSDEQPFRPNLIPSPVDSQQTNLLNLCMRASSTGDGCTSGVGVGGLGTKSTFRNHSRPSPYPTDSVIQRMKLGGWTDHTNVKRKWFSGESSLDGIEKSPVENQKAGLQWIDNPVLERNPNGAEIHSVAQHCSNTSEQAILFLGNTDMDVEHKILRDLFQVHHLADLDQMDIGTVLNQSLSKVTDLVISPGKIEGVERLIRELDGVKNIFLPEPTQTQLNRLRAQFPALIIRPIWNPINLDLAADYILTWILIAQTGSFELLDGRVSHIHVSSVHTTSILSDRRPQSWPSVSDAEANLKTFKPAHREYEDILDEGPVSEKQLSFGRGRINKSSNSFEKKALKDQTVGFLQWNPLTLAVARRLHTFGCLLLVADDQLPAGSDHVFGVKRVADQVRLATQSDFLLIIDEPIRLDKNVPTNWSEACITTELLNHTKRGSRLLYFGTSDHSPKHDILLHGVQSKMITQLILTAGLKQPVDTASTSRKYINFGVNSLVDHNQKSFQSNTDDRKPHKQDDGSPGAVSTESGNCTLAKP
ncbi:unnamed protein product [Echinostoma caproni]|uniref:THAP-type domain-containing protein n=1 Tax=Echinostoma caproni TaxID=27848 RepID=A0A183AIY5_9TREM|nr:unnamed protein product [Echinostoma caproni]